MNNLLLYGGTFDPVHKGHLNVVANVQAALGFQGVRFLPCKTPLLKQQAQASAADRVAMLKLAINSYPEAVNWEIDYSELERDEPSYMVTTLLHLKKQLPVPTAITLLLGMDAFLSLPRWHQWERLLDLANLLIIKRPNADSTMTEPLKAIFDTHTTTETAKLLSVEQGLIAQIDAGLFDISSSAIRRALQSGEDVSEWLPRAVLDYIRAKKLYIKA